jgi:hypothetical protein
MRSNGERREEMSTSFKDTETIAAFEWLHNGDSAHPLPCVSVAKWHQNVASVDSITLRIGRIDHSTNQPYGVWFDTGFERSSTLEFPDNTDVPFPPVEGKGICPRIPVMSVNGFPTNEFLKVST